jgi:hypothetical protein
MPSTYTLNNGIELIATGEQSGTWGDTTNTNLSLIDVSLDGQVSITLPSAGTSGSPNTLDIQDGTASNGRNRFIIFNDGGDLGSSAFVQLTPNDAEKIVYIRNNLSGSRSILVFQGTYNASNDYEIPSGTTAVVYFDGAGAGAVAANVFNNAYFDSLRLGSVSVTSILDEDNMGSDSATALATQQSIKAYVDSQVGTVDTLAEILANGNTTGGTDISVSAADDITFADSSKAIFGAGSDLQIYHNGANSYIDDTGTGNLYIRASDTVRLQSATGEQGVIVTTDGAVTLYHDNGAKLSTTATGIDVTGTVVSDGLTVASDSTYAIDVSRPSAGNTTLRVTSGSTAGNDVVLRADIGNTTGTSAVYFGDTDTNGIGRIMYEHNGDYMRFYTSSTEKVRITSAGNVGIGTTSPLTNLVTVGTTMATSQAFVGSVSDTSYSGGIINLSNSSRSIGITADPTNAGASSLINFSVDGSEYMRIDSSGNVGIGTSSPSQKLEVSGTDARIYLTGANTDIDMDNSASGQLSLDGNAYAFGIALNSSGANLYTNSVSRNLIFGVNETEVMRVTSDSVGIGTASPVKRLTISGASNGNITTLTDAATITPDLDSSDMFTVTLGGNRTLANPSNIDAGQTGSIFIVQDGTGSRTLAWGSYWDFVGGTAPTLSTAAGAVDRVDFIVRTSTSIHTVFTANYS